MNPIAQAPDAGNRGPAAWSALRISLVILAIAYIAQVVSPLRIVFDTESLLSIADSLERGTGLFDDGAPALHSPGYPVMIAGLLRIGAARPWAFIALNDLFLAVGMLCSYKMFQNHFRFSRLFSAALCAACLLSFVIVKHSVLALSDIPFFGLSSACLLFLTMSVNGNRNRIAYLWVALALLLLATLVRAIGVALLPAFLWTVVRGMLSTPTESRRSRLASHSALAVISVAGVIAATTFFSRYYEAAARHSTRVNPVRILSYRLLELGELALNTPSMKIPIGQAPYHAAGAALLVVILAGLWMQAGRPRLHRHDLAIRSLIDRLGPIDIFFLANSAILFMWAFMDARFWIPVAPFVLGYAALCAQVWNTYTAGRWAVAAYTCCFVASGVFAILYTTRISYAGKRFGDLYSGGSMRSTYCVALYACDPGAAPVEAKALYILRRYQ